MTTDTAPLTFEERWAREQAEKRTGYIAGLRALADALDADPDLPLPFTGSASTMSVFVETKTHAAAYARLMGKVEKKYTEGGSYDFELHGFLEGLRLAVYAPREQVCTRRVTGTREVTETLPDPEALAAVPTVTVTRTEEVVEWDCGSLLAPEQASA